MVFQTGDGQAVKLDAGAHNLALTRVLLAARRWGAMQREFRLAEARICYGLPAAAVDVDERGAREKVSVIPDAWLLFECLKSWERGKRLWSFPFLWRLTGGQCTGSDLRSVKS